MSVENAIKKYNQRLLAKGNTREPTRKNKKPERETENLCLIWCRANNFHVHVIEASAYDPITGRKTFSRAQAGISDLVGNTANGHSVYIELKAKDRRSTLKEHQRDFLEKKIHQNCFAVVVDTPEKLDQYWKQYCSLKSPQQRIDYLLDCLPKKRASRKVQSSGEHGDLPF